MLWVKKGEMLHWYGNEIFLHCHVWSTHHYCVEFLVLWLTPGRGSCLFSLFIKLAQNAILLIMSVGLSAPHIWCVGSITGDNYNWLSADCPSWPSTGSGAGLCRAGWAGSVVSRLLGGAAGERGGLSGLTRRQDWISRKKTHKLKLTSR